jgi:hypothetical protein
VAFLCSRQRVDGLWADFETLAGASTDWVTGYVGAALAAAGESNSGLTLASRTLRERQQADGGWGYHAEVPSDADSTAYALRFLLPFDRDGDHRAALHCLRRHRKGPAGGVATYAAPGPIRRYMGLDDGFAIDGWCQPHTEVTAAAGLAFAIAGGSWAADAQAAWRYLRARQGPAGSWRSYWWVDDLYPTAQAVALARAAAPGDDGRKAAARAAAWAAARQASDGSWASQADGASAFVTALGVVVLTSARGFAASAARGVAALVGQQQADGGWASSPILRIPPPHVVEPDDVGHWREDALGTGVVISDRGRLYTTATALNALCLASR